VIKINREVVGFTSNEMLKASIINVKLIKLNNPFLLRSAIEKRSNER
jgi:hypothetical protein